MLSYQLLRVTNLMFWQAVALSYVIWDAKVYFRVLCKMNSGRFHFYLGAVGLYGGI